MNRGESRKTGLGYSPPWLTSLIAVSSTFVSVVLLNSVGGTGTFSVGAILGVLGTLTLGLGIYHGRIAFVRSGPVLILLIALWWSVLTINNPSPVFLVAVFALVLGYDAGENAVTLGYQVRDVDALRIELVHLIGTILIAFPIAGVSYAIFRVSGGDIPKLSLVALFSGVVVLVAWVSLNKTGFLGSGSVSGSKDNQAP